jgi:hypothetical protein
MSKQEQVKDALLNHISNIVKESEKQLKDGIDPEQISKTLVNVTTAFEKLYAIPL